MRKFLFAIALLFCAFTSKAQTTDADYPKPTFIFLDTAGITQPRNYRIEIPPGLTAERKVGVSYSFINKDALIKFIYSKLKYPKKEKEDKIEGTVTITFIVERDGSLSNANVTKSVASGLDDEAIRLIKNLPHFTPAIYGAKPVRSLITMPILFLLENRN